MTKRWPLVLTLTASPSSASSASESGAGRREAGGREGVRESAKGAGECEGARVSESSCGGTARLGASASLRRSARSGIGSTRGGGSPFQHLWATPGRSRDQSAQLLSCRVDLRLGDSWPRLRCARRAFAEDLIPAASARTVAHITARPIQQPADLVMTVGSQSSKPGHRR